MLTYFHPPLGTIGIIAGWARERAFGSWFRGPLNDNASFIESIRKDLIEDHLAAARAAWLAEISPSPRPSPAGESASVSAFPSRRLGLAHGEYMDTVMPGHFCGEGRT